MKCSVSKVLLAFIFVLKFSVSSSQATIDTSSTENSVPDSDSIPIPEQNCPVEDETCRDDIVSYEAIKALHKQIDDDIDGTIDVSESKEFFRDELQNTDGFERQFKFHGKDDKISVQELWRAWKRSAVYNWTVDDVMEWLMGSVELPQYAIVFKEKNINGSRLPRVAVNSNHYISRDLGIKNTVHKHKLVLKAIDVVLFGPAKKPHNFLKDIALVISIIIALGGGVFAYRQNKASKDHLKKLMKDLDSLQKAEDYLSDLNEKLQKAEQDQNLALKEKIEMEQKYRTEIDSAKLEAERLKCERQGSDLEEMSSLQLAEEELIQVRAALRQAETELEARCYYGAPAELQKWLQYTFEIEQAHFSTKQQAAQRQFSSAKEACEKMRKKRMGMLGTLRIAQGNSIDDIDQRILQAKMAMEEIRNDLQERQQRWVAIENLCGFPIRTNPGLSKLLLSLYGDSGSLTSSGSSVRLATSMVAPLNVEDADEDFPPQYQAATGLGSNLSELKRRQVTMGSTGSLSKLPPQHLAGGSATAVIKKDSVESGVQHKSLSPSSNGSHSMPVSFHLGSNSPTSSPESPGSDHVFSQELPPPNSSIQRSRSSSGISNLQNGSRIPKRETAIPSVIAESSLSSQRCNSESSFQKRVLPKQTTTIGGVGAVQDDDSLSGTESIDSDGKKKDKKKLKLIPKFMRRTEH